jgi:hydroxymethylpyrimidine/phosphomethylpyrimidine kinase
MLGNEGAIEIIVAALASRSPLLPLVVDPVMVAKGGHKLLDDTALGALVSGLIPMATLVTPNIPEAEALTGMAIADVGDMVAAGRALLARGPHAVLVKGGHLTGPWLVDVLVGPDGVEMFEGARLESANTHGTGCTLASAIAAGLARGLPIAAAVSRARHYVQLAIVGAPGLGHGHGPLNHAHTVRHFEDER